MSAPTVKGDPSAPTADASADADRAGAHALSATQKMYWTLLQMRGAGGRLSGCNSIYVRGPHDLESLRRAVDRVLSRHVALRARFPMHEGVPVQYFDQPPPTAALVDLRLADAPLGEAKKLIETLHFTPFDLTTGVARACVIAIGSELSIIAWSMSHIVTDVQSARILFEDLVCHLAGEPERPVKSTFIDALVADASHPVAVRFPERPAFWKKEFADSQLIDLGKRRGDEAGVEDYVFPVPPELVERLRAVATSMATTPYSLMLGTFGGVLADVRKQRGRVAVGFVAANRTSDDADVVGCFAQSLPVTLDLSSTEDRFAHARAAVRRALQNAMPVADIMRAVERMGVFNVLLNDAVPRLPDGAMNLEPPDELVRVAAIVTPRGLPLFGFRRAKSLELLASLQPMHMFALDLSIFVTRGAVYGHYDRRRTDPDVVKELVGAFVERLLRI